jgi:hypothetical protein
MAKAQQTNSMPDHLGIRPGLNEYGQLKSTAWYPRIVAKTAAYTVKASESGTVFTTTGATGAVVFTLPAATDGPFHFTFINGAAQDMTVAGTSIITYNNAAAASVAFTTGSEEIGGSVEAWSDGVSTFVAARIASEAQTATVA